ncbi:MAG: helix-turn-helix transcriptional regulator [Cyanobacteria bacterium]|nr:helix-turn-helix transcriptional regulator [Cyanobacteriota bacterium]MDA0867636.1 helix-turn-helix transcriptional regulator [Cyanobacteriota bacterium]
MKVVFEVEIPELGKRLKEARELAGYSAEVAGARAGMTGGNFNRIENEVNKSVPVLTLIKAANAVGLDLSSVFGDWIKAVPGLTLESEETG